MEDNMSPQDFRSMTTTGLSSFFDIQRYASKVCEQNTRRKKGIDAARPVTTRRSQYFQTDRARSIPGWMAWRLLHTP
jgi:hypothetical protein